MTHRKRALVTLVVISIAAASARADLPARQSPVIDCRDVTECRTATETAIAQGEYERAHDLAWRTIHGTRNDIALMYLLARTQALSGRPDDALVMLRRLTELGVAPDASTGEFRHTRRAGWPPVEILIERAKSAKPVPVEPTAPVAPVAPVAPAAPASPASPASFENAGTFSSVDFAPGGFACDAVSGRYVLGDRPGRKLHILADGADHAIELTRAGFLDVLGLDINTRNGTLWVTSAEADGRGAALHRLQLISGRVLNSYGVPDGLGPARPIDVAVTASGAVLLLDAEQGRVLVLRSTTAAIEVLTNLQPGTPTSISVSSRDGVAYVALRDGLVRIDLRARVVAPVPGPRNAPIAGIERLRRYRASLVGVQTTADGARRLVRLSLDAAGRRVTALTVIEAPVPPGDSPIFTAVCGDELAFLVGEPGSAAASGANAWTVRRIRLKP